MVYYRKKYHKTNTNFEKAAKDLSNGNLHTKLEYHSQDELGSLADSMRETITTLSVYVNEIEKRC